MFVYYVFFFFQAEDGIRDRNVTGVQTCALPISHGGIFSLAGVNPNLKAIFDVVQFEKVLAIFPTVAEAKSAITGGQVPRSEERRVGKECRSRWSRYH